MGVHIVRNRDEVKVEGDVYIPEYEPMQRTHAAPCSHTGRKLLTVRMSCDNSVSKVCPNCGEAVR